VRIRAAIVSLAIGAAALGVAACGDDDDTSSTAASSATSTSADASGASVSFTEPADGATTGDTVTAEVDVQGFEIDAKEVGMANEEGHGHLHFSLDEGKYDYPKYSGPNGELAEQLGVEGMYSPSTEPAITYSNLPAGEHTLEVYLANNDHSDTGVEAETTFTVK
jgi:hypothetical protein